ncbi:acyl-[acyl-carrier-protein] thioesterase [Jeotgalibaca arthritidis]|uniref:Acyl-ACP thioesterase n=1 Tax=Jeotgalibaca arthritidis TaxID=1868794 RepID=A0A6G7KCQ5_9LACT|nr:acyl-ACP thioesterase domain-containing protein [Jeotgalibaca arthritidis]QII83036.1 acyl-ACP thioesterase [Jeotgalibaca arthritidis]
MSGLTFRTNHQVRSHECDIQGEMTIPSLINEMVHVSGVQSAALGNTEESMLEKGLSWIIIQYHMDIKRIPKKDERIMFETEALSYNRFFTYRVFRAFDTSDNLLVEVMTTFSIMDMESRKMTRIDKAIVAPYQAEEIRSLLRQPKIQPVDEDNQLTMPYRVRYLDIDANKHVNNSKYFDWIINTVDMAFMLEHRITAITIKYEKEVEFGNMIDSSLSMTEESNGQIVTAHQIKNGDVVACVANITWEKR